MYNRNGNNYRKVMKQISSKKRYLLVNAAAQIAFAMAFMCNRNPDVHYCAIAPILACGALLIGFKDEDD